MGIGLDRVFLGRHLLVQHRVLGLVSGLGDEVVLSDHLLCFLKLTMPLSI